jgi:hypothetical protein
VTADDVVVEHEDREHRNRAQAVEARHVAKWCYAIGRGRPRRAHWLWPHWLGAEPRARCYRPPSRTRGRERYERSVCPACAPIVSPSTTKTAPLTIVVR